ncbi:MAG: hypothetical protein V1914_03230 [archaeon]
MMESDKGKEIILLAKEYNQLEQQIVALAEHYEEVGKQLQQIGITQQTTALVPITSKNKLATTKPNIKDKIFKHEISTYFNRLDTAMSWSRINESYDFHSINIAGETPSPSKIMDAFVANIPETAEVVLEYDLQIGERCKGNGEYKYIATGIALIPKR